MKRTRQLLLLALLTLLTASLAWAAPSQGLLLIYNSKTESLDQHLQLSQELKKRRAAGHFKSKPQFSTAFAIADANIPQLAKALKTLGLPGATTPVPYLALVALDAKGRPTKVIWGVNWSDQGEVLDQLDARLGLQAKPVATPTPTPAPTPPAGRASTGVILVGDRANADILAVYGATRKVLGTRYPGLRKGANLADLPFAFDFENADQRAQLQGLGLQRDQAPLLVVADFTGKVPTRLIWSTRVTDADLAVAQLVTHFKGGTSTTVPTGDGKGMTNEKDGSRLVLIPGGTFTMGSNEGDDDEKPPHGVQVRAYYIGQDEVTNEQFQRFVQATGYQTEAEVRGGAHLFQDGHFTLVNGASWKAPKGPGSQFDPRKPVVCVTVKDAVAYCQWAGLRLPSEEEWELAARGTAGRTYPWGEKWDPRLCCNSANLPMGSAGGPSPVGTYPGGASPYGCLDMAGNVYEWTTSLYSKYPGGADNPRMDGVNLCIRGGSWGDPREESYRSFNRTFSPPNVALSSLGFRVARDK